MKTYWLASYPKSGNTWFRVFLSNLLFPELAPVDPSRLPLRNLIASAQGPFHEIVGAPPSLFTLEEVASLRPEIDTIVGRDWSGPACIRKAHDAYTYLPDGRPLMGKRPDFAAIYIVRNPWDVAVSLASHWQQPIEKTVKKMCQDETAIDNRKNRSAGQLPQRLLSWSNHVKSWAAAPIDICIMRYEDLHAHPLESFRSAVQFLGLTAKDIEIETAIEASSFDRLNKIEQERGFREAPGKNIRFFRKGTVGDGRSQLDDKSLKMLIRQNEIAEHALKSKRETSK